VGVEASGAGVDVSGAGAEVSGTGVEASGAGLDVSGAGLEVSGTDDASDVTGQMVVETAVVIVITLIESAGQSGTSEEQARVVEVKVLKTVDVVIVIEVSVGVVGGTVGDSPVELKVMERLLEPVGSTTVNDEESTFKVELTTSPVEATRVVSALEAGVLDSAVEEDSTMVAAVDVLSAVVEDGVGVEAGWQSNLTLSISTSQSSSLPCSGILKDTEIAPPHWEFFTLLPPLEHDSVCLQDEPSGIS
jgi:hypothetical protein